MQVLQAQHTRVESRFPRNGVRGSTNRGIEHGRSVLALQLFREIDRNTEAAGEVVGDVVSANGKHAGVAEDPAVEEGVLGRARHRGR
jgi:hypothetical protein